jgi:hypothetical protein
MSTLFPDVTSFLIPLIACRWRFGCTRRCEIRNIFCRRLHFVQRGIYEKLWCDSLLNHHLCYRTIFLPASFTPYHSLSLCNSKHCSFALALVMMWFHFCFSHVKRDLLLTHVSMNSATFFCFESSTLEWLVESGKQLVYHYGNLI